MKTERGSASLELVLVTPVLLIVLLLVVAGGRVSTARGDLDAAARDGARAASLARTPQQARADAISAIDASMQGGNMKCNDVGYDINVGDLHPGSIVDVSVRCEVSFAELTQLPLPASKTMTAQFSEVVDTYRQVST